MTFSVTRLVAGTVCAESEMVNPWNCLADDEVAAFYTPAAVAGSTAQKYETRRGEPLRVWKRVSNCYCCSG